jgi:hypothetical protein
MGWLDSFDHELFVGVARASFSGLLVLELDLELVD